MNKNAKIIVICLLFLTVCICLSLCSQNIADFITGEDGKCDYCGNNAGIEQGTKEYCGPCFAKYDGDFWH